MRGQVVCQTHGGRAPQNRAAADQRLKELAHPAVDVLQQLLNEPDAPAIRLAAARDILDRAGYSARQRIDVTSNGQSLIKSVPTEDMALIHGPG